MCVVVHPYMEVSVSALISEVLVYAHPYMEVFQQSNMEVFNLCVVSTPIYGKCLYVTLIMEMLVPHLYLTSP